MKKKWMFLPFLSYCVDENERGAILRHIIPFYSQLKTMLPVTGSIAAIVKPVCIVPIRQGIFNDGSRLLQPVWSAE